MRAALVIGLVFIAGYATQRGSTCAVSAACEIVEERRATRFLGFLFCGSIGLTALSAAALGGFMPGSMPMFPALSPVQLAGSALFGLGAWINGRCAFGTIAELGSGESARLATLGGFFGGALAMALLMVGTAAGGGSHPLQGIDPGLLLIAAGGCAILLGLGIRKEPASDGQWPTLWAMSAIGLVNAILLLVAQGWAYTALLGDVARRHAENAVMGATLALSLIAGAVAGAVTSGTWRPRLSPPRLWAMALAGGALMGSGAALVPGGNDTMLMSGIAMLQPGLSAAYAVMMAVLIVLAFARHRRANAR